MGGVSASTTVVILYAGHRRGGSGIPRSRVQYCLHPNIDAATLSLVDASPGGISVSQQPELDDELDVVVNLCELADKMDLA